MAFVISFFSSPFLWALLGFLPFCFAVWAWERVNTAERLSCDMTVPEGEREMAPVAIRGLKLEAVSFFILFCVCLALMVWFL